MAGFRTELDIVPVDGGRYWRLTAPLVYDSDIPDVGTIVVPAGFVYDGNSMPRLTWLWSPKMLFPEAGAVHDWAWREKFSGAEEGNLPRAQANAVYREILEKVHGVGGFRRWARWLGVTVSAPFMYPSSAPRLQPQPAESDPARPVE